MSNPDPPTVLTRGPPTESPDQPSSPAPSPSRSQSIDQETILSEITSTRPFFNGRDPRERSEDEDEDEEGRGKGKGKGKGPETQRREPRWRELLTEWKLLLSLENSGSVARDHLASERTFLAYARTSLTIASTGVALVQLFTLSAVTTDKDFEKYARPVGTVMIGLGLFTLAIGVTRFFLVQDALIRGMYPVARITPTFLSFVLSVVIVVVFVVILIAR
ncbi:hypothetical protein C8Q74DRAFT_1369569 [Fomes fomentarius]|nr:hypothetical protein C8Q74DRAFT_1369569 [Fomes fomentarius]